MITQIIIWALFFIAQILALTAAFVAGHCLARKQKRYAKRVIGNATLFYITSLTLAYIVLNGVLP